MHHKCLAWRCTIWIPGRPRADVKPYSWSLKDIIERGLFIYLFAETDRQESNFAALVHDLEGWLTEERTERDGVRVRQLVRHTGKPSNLRRLAQGDPHVDGQIRRNPFSSSQHHSGTIRKLYRRLFLVLSEGQGVLRRKEQQGKPLVVTDRDTCDPKVIDLSALAAVPSLSISSPQPSSTSSKRSEPDAMYNAVLSICSLSTN